VSELRGAVGDMGARIKYPVSWEWSSGCCDIKMSDVRLVLSGVLCQCTNNNIQGEQATDRLKIVYHIMKEKIPRVNMSCFASTFFFAGFSEPAPA
jgi:hypothetical protein